MYFLEESSWVALGATRTGRRGTNLLLGRLVHSCVSRGSFCTLSTRSSEVINDFSGGVVGAVEPGEETQRCYFDHCESVRWHLRAMSTSAHETLSQRLDSERVGTDEALRCGGTTLRTQPSLRSWLSR